LKNHRKIAEKHFFKVNFYPQLWDEVLTQQKTFEIPNTLQFLNFRLKSTSFLCLCNFLSYERLRNLILGHFLTKFPQFLGISGGGEEVEISKIRRKGLVHKICVRVCANFHEILSGELLGKMARVKTLTSNPPVRDYTAAEYQWWRV
jgi:hypothetical protein